MFIDGTWGSASPLPRFAVFNPADGATINELPDAGAAGAAGAIAAAPFGRMKDSGLGRKGGQEGIAEYLETKLGGFAI